MAGITDIQNPDPNISVADAEAQVSMLDEARNELRGIQKGSIRDLFNYDKALSERHSSPGSKMYLENAADRERAISGYAGTATKEVNNLFDIMENVRRASDDLKALLAKKSGSGSGSDLPFSISDLNTWLNGAGDGPQPPADLMAKYNSGEPGILVYKVLPDKTVDWQWKKGVLPGGTYDPAVSGVDPGYEVWRPGPDRGAVLKETFGLDKATVAQLSAISAVFGEKKANQLLWSYIQSGFTRQAGQEVDTTGEAITQIKSYKTREDARADFERNKEALQAKGVDVDRVDREIDIYFDKQEATAGSAESTKSFIEALKEKKGK